MKKKKNKTRTMPKFSEEEMKRAVLKVAVDGASVNRVSQELGLCTKTLKSYVDKYLNTAEDKKDDFIFRPNYEINQVFTHELEKLFEDYLLNVNITDKKLTREYVRLAAYEFAISCNLHVPKTWNLRQQAGLDWMYGFLNRHPIIKKTIALNKKLKAGKKTSITENPCESMDYIEEAVEEVVVPEDIELSNVVDIKTSEDLRVPSPTTVNYCPKKLINGVRSTKHSPSRIVADGDEETHNRSNYLRNFIKLNLPAIPENVIEGNFLSGISVKTSIEEFAENLHSAYCAISEDGYVPSDRVYSMDEITLVVENPQKGGQDRIVVTACCFISANGCSFSPFMIFPRSKFKESMLHGYAPHVCGVASPEGIVDDDIFMCVLHHFRDYIHASVNNKVVLIVDDDDYHITINTIDFCEKYGIELVTLPPHCAGRLQPIGRYAYRMLKSYFYNACCKYRSDNPEKFISMYDVSSLFNSIYPYSFTEENIVRGFNETGIYPLDEKIFTEVDAVTMKYEIDDLPNLSLEHDIELVPSSIVNSDSSDDENDDVDEKMPLTHDSNAEDDMKSSKILAPLRDLTTEYDLRLAVNFEKTPLEEYFDGLVFAYNELNDNGNIAPNRVYNMDEIELLVRTPECKSNDESLRLVASCCVNAAGQSLPPCFVHPNGGTSNKSEVENSIEGAKSIFANLIPNEDDVFMEILKHFAQHFSSSPKNRVILVIDDDHSHITIKSMEFCFRHGITLVTVPPRTALPLQPLEKTVFKTLTANFAAECNRHLEKAESGKHGISMRDVTILFRNVYTDTFLAETIIKGFEDVGIWPLNQDKISGDEHS